jgi:hypothetical protein
MKRATCSLATLLALLGGMSGGCSSPRERALFKNKSPSSMPSSMQGEEVRSTTVRPRHSGRAGRSPRPWPISMEYAGIWDGAEVRSGYVAVYNMTNGKFLALTYNTQYWVAKHRSISCIE